MSFLMASWSIQTKRKLVLGSAEIWMPSIQEILSEDTIALDHKIRFKFDKEIIEKASFSTAFSIAY